MEEVIETNLKKSVRNWWISVLVGILSIGLGVWCYLTPVATLLALTIVFVVGFLVSGIFGVIFSIANRKRLRSWGWSLISGLVDLFVAYLMFTLSTASVIILIYYIGFWIMFQSFWAVGIAVQLHSYKINTWGWPFALGILGVILSFILIYNPTFAAGVIIILTSLSFIGNGVIRIHYGITLRKVKRLNDII